MAHSHSPFFCPRGVWHIRRPSIPYMTQPVFYFYFIFTRSLSPKNPYARVLCPDNSGVDGPLTETFRPAGGRIHSAFSGKDEKRRKHVNGEWWLLYTFTTMKLLHTYSVPSGIRVYDSFTHLRTVRTGW